VSQFRKAVPAWLDRQAAPIVAAIQGGADLDAATRASLDKALSALVTEIARPAPSPSASPGGA
jgi:hypothetical protein